ncbi:MAG: NADH:flavin oxidoreductase [Deltaproteobacteria bacterium]|nr:NADH:flavin oxidoreductase [Deltaproteobacteria bacterium]
MGLIFSPLEINGMRLPNRLVRSATFDGEAEPNGEVSEAQIGRYRDLAAGGVGLIVTCATCVSENGRFYPNQNRLDRDSSIAGHERLNDAVHRQGGKLVGQLFHGGREVSRRTGRQGLGPSVVQDPRTPELKYREITEAEIWQVVKDFGNAAARARKAGYDAVQIHGAHAFLFAQFLSPDSNRREDKWGGDLGNRLRLHREVLADIRAKVGPDYPVMMKFGLRDGFDEGLTLDEGLQAAKVLAQAGCDCLEISQGLRGTQELETEFRTELQRPEDRGYFRQWAQAVKAAVDVPVIAVGGIRDMAMVEDILHGGEADLVAMCRPFICEPDLVDRWRRGDREPARCVSCNRCKRELASFRPIQCFLDSQ